MRPGARRTPTARAAAKTNPKLQTRLSKGEKRNHKQMAALSAVYDATPAPRTPTDIPPGTDDGRRDTTPGPRADNKWLVASLARGAASVIDQIFDEADRRDPTHRRTSVALVDGNNHQIDRITAQAKARTVPITIVIDFVHVLEYLWKATWCCHTEGDPAAEAWVRRHAQKILAGRRHPRRRRHQMRRHQNRPGTRPPRRRRHLRHLPNQQTRLPQPPHRPHEGLADRHRRHRRRLPTPRQRSHGPHRRPLGPRRRRGHPHPPRPTQQRRLRRVLALPPRPGAATRPPIPLPQQRHTAGNMRTLQKSRTQVIPLGTASMIT